MSFVEFARVVKRSILPSGSAFRRIKFGPAAGRIMKIDLHHDMRLYLGVYERELLPHYRRLLKPGMKSFDIGARDGYSALLIGSLTRSDVVSFDSETGAVEQMRAVFGRNSLPIRAAQAYVGSTVDSRSTTVDEAAAKYFPPDFLKIDVEGAEAEVLAGAAKTLATKKPSIIVEVHGRQEEADCLKILREAGYKPAVVDQVKVWRECRSPENHWLVCER